MRSFYRTLFFLLFFIVLDAKYPDLTEKDVQEKTQEIFRSHALYRSFNDEIAKRILSNFIEELDPLKTYFIKSDIQQWLNPSKETLEAVQEEFKTGTFHIFFEILDAAGNAIKERRKLEKQIDLKKLPKKVSAEEFRDLDWATSLDELKTRLMRMKALQLDVAAKFSPEQKEKSLQRLEKRQIKREDEILSKDPALRQKLVYTDIIKAFAGALDSHTAYFTPEEAKQFMIQVQQRLVGIGAQLRDDITGFSVVKIIEGGPAALGKQLKVKDVIIAVDGEPVVGMGIEEAVEMIRGQPGTTVSLTVMRKIDDDKTEIDTFNVERGEVVLKETRYDSSFQPFGNTNIGYLRLFTFYQDQDSSSSEDLLHALKELQKGRQLDGLILDLRGNAGGLLSQAVDVAGLFIGKGVVVSIKDETGKIQRLRHLDPNPAWKGPLIVLVNKTSASASEIVAGTLQDYGRALIVGDEHTWGKGSFQTFTLNPTKKDGVNAKGEYKVTRGMYYTVSGNTPQLKGVIPNIIVPGTLAETELGESKSKYPLPPDTIASGFDDPLDDIPSNQRDRIRLLYKFDLEKKQNRYTPYLETLISNSSLRIKNNKSYQQFLKELKELKGENEENQEAEPALESAWSDLQLDETFSIMKDLLYLEKTKKS